MSFQDEMQGAMSDKSSALRAKSDEADRLKPISPAGHGQHGRADCVARRSQNFGYARSSRLADRTRGAHDGAVHSGVTGH
jgi:hypothetical protein